MAFRICTALLSVFFFLVHLSVALPSPDGALVFEDGYTVTTVIDGDKSNYKINPHAILHQSPPSDLFIVLDSAASTFYTVSMPSASTNETVIERLVGNGDPSYVDGDLGSARFNKPRSFAVDHNGNVYVADQRNHAIRKITKSGVSTIAGGYTQKAGRADGAGRDATFSEDFELTFIPEVCALMISDHGNRLVRQINLRAGDCRRHSRSALGTTSSWILGLGFSSLVGLILGFVIRPHVLPYEGHKPHLPYWTWTYYLMNLETQVVMLCSDIKNAVVESAVYGFLCKIIALNLSLLPLMFQPIMLKSHATQEKTVALLELDEVCNSSNNNSSSSNLTVSPDVDDPLKDLLTSYGQLVPETANSSSSNLTVSPDVDDPLKDLLTSYGQLVPETANEAVVEEHERKSSNSSGEPGNIDAMILANLVNFEEQTATVANTDALGCSLGLVKRR